MISKPRIRENYERRRDLGLIFSLLICLLLIRWAAGFQVYPDMPKTQIPQFTFEDIPPTEQGRKRPLPQKPAIPIPSSEEDIPDEETIEPIKFEFYSDAGDDGGGGALEAGVGGAAVIPPRPIAWVIPEYPEEEKKKGIRGEVKLSLEIDATGRVLDAVVIENQTGSALCAQAAIKAALASRFIPAMKGNVPTSFWLIQPYRFDLSK